MKFLLLCLPLVFAAPVQHEKQGKQQFNFASLKSDSQILVDLLGHHFTQDDCKRVCDMIDEYMVHSCPSVCEGMAFFKSAFDLKPHPSASMVRRSFLDAGFNLNQMKIDAKMVLDLVGSNATEQVCENALHGYIVQGHGHILDYAVPVICQSAKYIINLFHLHPDPTNAAPLGKRNFLGSFHIKDLFAFDELKADVQAIVDVIGSDPTEALCEQECHKLIKAGSVFDIGVPFLCRSLQFLIHKMHIVRDPTTTVQP